MTKISLDFLLEGVELTEQQRKALEFYRYDTTNIFGQAKLALEEETKQITFMPETYDHDFTWSWLKLNKFPHLDKTEPRIRALLIGEYLLSETEEFLDMRGNDYSKVSRLEGELRRWWAREKGLLPRDVTTTPDVIDRYCTAYNLQELKTFMVQALNI